VICFKWARLKRLPENVVVSSDSIDVAVVATFAKNPKNYLPKKHGKSSAQIQNIEIAYELPWLGTEKGNFTKTRMPLLHGQNDVEIARWY